jgi:hypothetical protein
MPSYRYSATDVSIAFSEQEFPRSQAVALVPNAAPECGQLATIPISLMRGFERYRLWLLKKSIFLKTAEIWGIENVYPNRESRLYGILARFYFYEFRGKDFFNSHACSSTVEQRSSGRAGEIRSELHDNCVSLR